MPVGRLATRVGASGDSDVRTKKATATAPNRTAIHCILAPVAPWQQPIADTTARGATTELLDGYCWRCLTTQGFCCNPVELIAGLRRHVARGHTAVTASPDANLLQELDGLRHRIELIEARVAAREDHFFVPSPPFPPAPLDEFMRYSTCSSADFVHPRYVEICGMLKHPCDWHRKLWEWVFVVHHLLESGVVSPGSKGLVFGVGSERLPALFASLGAKILATDAPSDVGEAEGWVETGQHLSSLAQIRYPEIVDGEVFGANVSFSTCDMRNIPSELVDFDFNWSSCCFEHLGSLEAGMDFVVNAVENTLRKGGVAVHTTEFNLTSNDLTVKEGPTVIYRRRDIEELVQRLRDRGHIVKEFTVAPPSHYWDFHVDTPPYTSKVHLKLLLERYVTTSVGIVVQRGA